MPANHRPCANDKFDTQNSAMRAGEGIINPVHAVMSAGSTIFRFGSSFEKAVFGDWWYGGEQHAQIQAFAALHKLAYPYAARVLSATLHAYSDMTHLVRVKTSADLVYYHGRSKEQVGHVPFSGPANPIVRERMREVEMGVQTPFIQFFIPGLHDKDVNGDALGSGRPVSVFAAAESHMFGTTGAPRGAKLQ